MRVAVRERLGDPRLRRQFHLGRRMRDRLDGDGLDGKVHLSGDDLRRLDDGLRDRLR